LELSACKQELTDSYVNVAEAVIAKPVAGSPPSPEKPVASVQRAPSGKCK